MLLGKLEVAASALLLDQKFAFPEKVDETAAVTETLNRLFVGGDAAAVRPKDLEKFVVESLGFSALVVASFQSSANWAARARISFQLRRIQRYIYH